MMDNQNNYLMSKIFYAFIAGFIISSTGCDNRNVELSPGEIESIRELNTSYTKAWEADDPGSVLATFTENAKLIPHHGVAVVEGHEAIRAFWWPADSPPTDVIEFTATIDEISGRNGMAYFLGRFSLTFSFESDGVLKTFDSAGNYMSIARKQSDGNWKMTHRIWNDPVPQQR